MSEKAGVNGHSHINWLMKIEVFTCGRDLMKPDATKGLKGFGRTKMKPSFSDGLDTIFIIKFVSGKTTLAPGIVSARKTTSQAPFLALWEMRTRLISNCQGLQLDHWLMVPKPKKAIIGFVDILPTNNYQQIGQGFVI